MQNGDSIQGLRCIESAIRVKGPDEMESKKYFVFGRALLATKNVQDASKAFASGIGNHLTSQM